MTCKSDNFGFHRWARRQLSACFLMTSIGILGGIDAAVAAGVTLADSVQDFSGVQGSQPGEWQYGYYTTPGDAGSFELFGSDPTLGGGYDASENIWEETATRPGHPGAIPGVSSWAFLDESGGHPTSFPRGNRSVVRRWISDYAGAVTVAGFFGDINTNGEVLGRILLNGVANQIVPDTTLNAEQPYAFQTVLALGDRLDFEIDPVNTDFNDSATFTAQIQTHSTAVPTPALLPGIIGFGASLLKKRRDLSDAEV